MKTEFRLLAFILLICFVTSGCHAGNSTKTHNLVKNILAKMVLIPAGTYTMGPSNPNWQVGNDTPPHRVHLNSFYMDRYNVSYREYDTYTQATGKSLIQKQYKNKWDFFRNDTHPVNNITWYQANEYCQWLAKRTDLPFSLPTEAQWEYVARNLGKKNWAFATNNGKQELGKNFPSFAQLTHQKGDGAREPVPLPVGSLPCTPMGICGMNGEVDQWVKDWFSLTYYARSPVNNPQGPATGKQKVYRGGSAMDSPEYNNVFNRYHAAPNKAVAGFRCVINSDLPMSKLTAIANKHLHG